MHLPLLVVGGKTPKPPRPVRALRDRPQAAVGVCCAPRWGRCFYKTFIGHPGRFCVSFVATCELGEIFSMWIMISDSC